MAILAGDKIYAAHHNVTRQVYTPQLLASSTNPTLGSGSQAVGSYYRDPISGWCEGYFAFQFGSSGVSAGSGNLWVTLPFAALGFFSTGVGSGDNWGTFSIRDNSNPNGSRWGVLVRISSNGGPGGVAMAALGLYDGTTPFVTNSAPWTWDANDTIVGHFQFFTTPDV